MSLFAGFVTLCLEGRFTQRVMLPFPGQSWFARHLPTAQCLWFPPRSGTRLARGRLSMPTIGKGIMKVVCAGGQVNGGDLESVDVSLVAAPCCCTRVDAHSSGGHQESPSLQGRYWFVSSCSTLDPRSAKNASHRLFKGRISATGLFNSAQCDSFFRRFTIYRYQPLFLKVTELRYRLT